MVIGRAGLRRVTQSMPEVGITERELVSGPFGIQRK